MLNPSNIIRSKRKSLAIFIDSKGELWAKAPLNFPVEKIYKFVASKENWILARKRAINQNSYINKSVLSYQSFYFLGEEVSPIVTTGVKLIAKQDGVLLIPKKFAELKYPKYLKKIEKWLKDCAQKIVQQRTAYFSSKLGLTPGEIKTNNNKTRWGVCEKSGNIAINWRAIMLPANLLDYIIVHEFCHLLEFNHSKQFWQIVETILPDWRATRKHLRQMNWILSLFR